jgi:hypothetical protein
LRFSGIFDIWETNQSGTWVPTHPKVWTHVRRGLKCYRKYFWALAAFTFCYISFSLLGDYAEKIFGIKESLFPLSILLFSLVIFFSPLHTALLVACRSAIQGKSPTKLPLFILDNRTKLVLWVDSAFFLTAESLIFIKKLGERLPSGAGLQAIYFPKDIFLFLLFIVGVAVWWITSIRLYPALVFASGDLETPLYKSWKVTDGNAWEILALRVITGIPGLIFFIPILFMSSSSGWNLMETSSPMHSALFLAGGIYNGFSILVNSSFSLAYEKRMKGNLRRKIKSRA